MHFIGRIDRDIYRAISEDITTDEAIITDERIQHIREKHPNDFERYERYLTLIVGTPDYVIEANKPASAVLLKDFEEDCKHFQAILRLHTSADDPAFKNSIITFMRIDDKEWKRLIRNKKVLYKRE